MKYQMKYQNHTAKYYASKAINFAESTVKYPNIPQSTYDKGYFAVEGALTDWETAKYNAAFGWWVKELDRLEESDEESPDGFYMDVLTLIGKNYKNRR